MEPRRPAQGPSLRQVRHTQNPTPEPAAELYEIQRGDTLSGIAKRHYGDASQYMKIFAANKGVIEHPDKIYPGQKIRIPAA